MLQKLLQSLFKKNTRKKTLYMVCDIFHILCILNHYCVVFRYADTLNSITN